MKSSTGFVYTPYYLEHDTGRHPESARRLQVIVKELQEKDIYNNLVLLEPYKATEQDLALVHDPDYAKEVWKKCVQKINYLDMDTIICDESYNVALMAVGGVLRAIDALMKNEVKNAFCAVRPPGHHAEVSVGMGFCLFNNVAIGARYAQNKYNLKNILIVDWDAHHGNGTQHTFYNDPTVLYFSIHQFPHYPGTGRETDIGKDKGEGFNVNVPVSSKITEEEFLKCFTDALIPAAEKIKPDLIIISAGFDSHKDDLLANLPVTEAGYQNMTKTIMNLADKYCNGRIVSVLEGGYNLKALAKSTSAHITTLMGEV